MSKVDGTLNRVDMRVDDDRRAMQRHRFFSRLLYGCGHGAILLVDADAGFRGDRRELLDFFRDKIAESVRRGCPANDVVLLEPKLKLGVEQDRVRLRVQA